MIVDFPLPDGAEKMIHFAISVIVFMFQLRSYAFFLTYQTAGSVVIIVRAHDIMYMMIPDDLINKNGGC